MALLRILIEMLRDETGKGSATRVLPVWIVAAGELMLHVEFLGIALSWWTYDKWSGLNQDLIWIVLGALTVLTGKALAEPFKGRKVDPVV